MNIKAARAHLPAVLNLLFRSLLTALCVYLGLIALAMFSVLVAMIAGRGSFNVDAFGFVMQTGTNGSFTLQVMPSLQALAVFFGIAVLANAAGPVLRNMRASFGL